MHLRNPRPHRAIVLIQIGNFFENFDLMLSVHSTVLLNGLFFPHASPLFAAFTFCLTFVLRPVGALLFGYLGDFWGRKSMIIYTTTLMGACALGLALLPSYQSLGVVASLLFIALRMLQGLSSVGEAAGCSVYIAETVPAPAVHFQITLRDFFADVGSLLALLVSSAFLLLDPVQGWRYAFLVGSSLAVLAGLARTYLLETPEFKKAEHVHDLIPTASDRRNLLYYSLVECLTPLGMYFVYIYMSELLKCQYGLSPAQVISHNVGVVCIEAAGVLSYAALSLKICPLKILRIRTGAFLGFLACLPLLMENATTPTHILLIQGAFILLGRGADPAHAPFIRSFPSLRRYTQTALAFALPRMLMYVVASYGCVFFHEAFGFTGITTLFMGFAALSLWGSGKFQASHRKEARHG